MPARLHLTALLLFCPTLLAQGPAKKYPAEILLIRHAEKPPDRDASPHLSPAGEKRAKALPALFVKSDARPAPFARPDALFAAADSKKSNRPTATLAPLAKELKLPVNATFHNAPGGAGGEKGIAELAAEVLGGRHEGKVVLICWRHGHMPDLAHALGARGPLKYPSPEFGRVWRITFDADGRAKLVDLPQRLMPGDSRR